MKRRLRDALRGLGLDLVTARTGVGLELLLRLQRLRSRPPYFFIQVGAQDGVTGDPIRGLVAQGSWTGVLIEPRRSMFERLREGYASSPGVTFLNCAVTAARGQRTLFALDDRDGTLPAWAHGLGTFDRDVLLRHEPEISGLRDRIVTETVDCRTWTDILDDLEPPKVDLLQIDAEGMDYELVRSFPLSRIRPGIIRYEHKHLSANDRVECEQLLVAGGYTPVVAERDTTAYRADL